MAHTINALKRQRQDKKRNARNTAVKSEVRTQIKKVLQAVEKKDASQAQTEFVKAASLLDRAARKGVLHRNNAQRRKSRLATKVRSLEAKK